MKASTSEACQLVVWLGVALLVWAGCRKQAGTEVARVGRATLTLEEVNRDIPYQLRGTLSAAQKREAAERWLEDELLYQEALRRGIDKEPEISVLLDKVRRDILIASLLERESEAEGAITEEQIVEYYNGHLDDFIRDEPEIWVRHILVETRAQALDVRSKLQSGVPFESVAREVSVEVESAVNGGDLGYVSEEIADAAFWKAISSMKPGQISRPILTNMGYHIAEVRGKKEKGTARELDLVRPEIINAILLRTQQVDRELLVNKLRERSSWHLYPERLQDDRSVTDDSLRQP